MSWCESKVYPKIKETNHKAVVVLDRAIYHTFLDDLDRRPTSLWNKSRIADAIVRWNGVPEDWPLTWKHRKTKGELLAQARQIYPSPTYKIQKIANEFVTEEFNIKILFLPVAHPELNPIEMVWSKMKRSIAGKNMTHRLSAVEEQTRRKVELMTAFESNRYVEYVKVEEDKFKNLSTE